MLGGMSAMHALSPDQVRQTAERQEKRRRDAQAKAAAVGAAVPSPAGPAPKPLPLPVATDRQPAPKPLFQRCLDLIATLYSFPMFEFYLFPAGLDTYVFGDQIANPIDVLWNCFKLGAPLCVVFNELAATTNGDFLDPDDVSGVKAPFFPSKPCKANLYKFIAACHAEELNLTAAKELGGVSELYKDDMEGFMKFLRLVEDLIEKIKLSGNLPPPKELPFSAALSKDFVNPLDNRSRLIKELIETERAYIFSLEELQRYQAEVINTKILSKEMVSNLFSNLNELLDFQRRFMVAMESTLNMGLVEQRIGQLFILNEDPFEIYFPFCCNYQDAQEFAATQTEELQALNHVIPHHQLQSYMIKPLQRLMKYPLLLKELIKLTDPETYPYMDELKEGLEAIKRVTEKLNEIQRRDENERTRLDLMARMDDWKGLQIRDFGDLLLTDRFWISSNDQEREYSLFLFERILLCCKKEVKQRKSGARKNSVRDGENYSYILRGNIYISYIFRVEDSSNPNLGVFSISVHWKEANEPDAIVFSLRGRNEEQVLLWTDRLDKQVALYRRRKNSAKGIFNGNYSSGPAMIRSASTSAVSSYGAPGYPQPMQQFASPLSPYSQPALQYDSYRTGVQSQFGFASRSDSVSSLSSMASPRLGTAPTKRIDTVNGRRVSREAPSALASLASSGLPMAGFSDDEGNDSESGDGGRESLDYVSRQSDGVQMYARKQSVANGMMMGASTAGSNMSVYAPSSSDGSYSFQASGYQNDYYESASSNVTMGQNHTFLQPQNQYQPLVNSGQYLRSAQPVGNPPPMRRNPTAPASAAFGVPTPGQSSSFIKIRAHYESDILIIVMPTREARINDLRNRVERKMSMMPYKPMLSQPVNLVVKEEVIVPGAQTKEWRVVGALESDEDVARAFVSHSGILNLFLS